MHKQAVAVCNYVLDRQTIVDRVTGLHSTVDSWFADHLVQSSSDFEKVPASRLLPGIDY
jgi:hypothetical protein